MRTPESPQDASDGKGDEDYIYCKPDQLDAARRILASTQADSHANTERDQTQQPGEQQTTQLNQRTSSEETGDIPPTSPTDANADADKAPTREVDFVAITKRFRAEGRWNGQIELERDEMFKLARKQFKDKTARQQWVYGELDRMYPPLENAQIAHSEGESRVGSKGGSDAQIAHSGPLNTSVQNAQIAHSGDGSIQGLSTIPEAWPELPANASLAAELGWVQANRLRSVSEKLGRATVVDLGRALSPAPSWSALGWLETSIRSYAKFVDVAAKVTGGDEGEGAVVRRERVSIDEMRTLLASMVGADVCPTCGRAI